MSVGSSGSSELPVRFFIAGIRRTGTTLIRMTLNEHPDVRCVGEAFNFHGRFGPTHGNEYGYRKYLDAHPMLKVQDIFARDRVVTRFLDEIYATPNKKAIGFKLMLEQNHRMPMVLDYLRQHNTRVIQVVRLNVLKTLISRTVKKKTGIAHSTSKDVKRTKVTLRDDRLVRHLEKIERENAQWERECAGLQYMRVNYEDFVSNKQAELARLLGFLEINSVPELDPGRVKLTSDNLREVIENYDAVEKALRGSKFEWCLTK